MAVSPALLTREVLPFALRLLALLLATLVVDAGLHLIDAVWIGRYLGIPGVLLIAVIVVTIFVYPHQKARIEARHAREGIRNIDNCVRCHRSAEDEGGEGEGREGGEGRE